MRSTEPWILSRTTWATVTGRQVFAPGTGERPSMPLTATAIAGVHCRSGCSRTMILMRGSLDTRTPLPTSGCLTTTPNKRPEVLVSTFEAFQAEMGRFNLGALSCLQPPFGRAVGWKLGDGSPPNLGNVRAAVLILVDGGEAEGPHRLGKGLGG